MRPTQTPLGQTANGQTTNRQSPLGLHTPLAQLPGLGRALDHVARRMLALPALEQIYASANQHQGAQPFCNEALHRLGVNSRIAAQEFAHLPRSGASVVVANHPYGGLEGLLLIELLLRVRSDVKVLANHLLWRMSALRDVLIPVNVLSDKRRGNSSGLRAAIEHVRSGGMLVIFPAGAVSHLHMRATAITDPEWKPQLARLLRHCDAPITPVYFAGHNSLRFQLAGLIHPLLRTALLPRELVNKQNVDIAVRIGAPMAMSAIKSLPDRALMQVLRLRTYDLQHATTPGNTPAKPAPSHHAQPAIAAPIAAALLHAELMALPTTQQLLTTSSLQVSYAHARQIPWTLQELGRLRELTFRAVGEGTGKALDLDLFDNYYTHLICWNPETAEIVGSYRLGDLQQLANNYGLKGLYTHTLFKFGQPLLKQLGNALELGRSFVRPEYQRSFAPLLALWRGIATYVARHPHYRVLFGPVSISNDYRPESRAMLLEYLQRHCLDSTLSKLIKPRTPIRQRRHLLAVRGLLEDSVDLDDVSSLLSQLEPDQKGVPVLLRQYLKLGGKLLGFNLDANFNDVIDGLIVVDLPSTDTKTLQRYMGKQETLDYQARHQRRV